LLRAIAHDHISHKTPDFSLPKRPNIPFFLLAGLVLALPLVYWPTLFLGASLPRYAFLHFTVSGLFLTWAFTKPLPQ